MGRWVRFVALAVLVLGTAIAGGIAGGTAGATAVPEQAAPMRVSMYGDSVMLGARDQLLQQFAGQQVTVDAVEDRSLLGATSIFRSAGPALGDVVVLDLGYNDESDPAVFRGRIDDAMAALAGVKHVIWLNQHDWGPGRAGMNAELAAAASRHPNLEVVDWNAEVAAHPDDVYPDQIHLTPAGQVAMGTMVRQHFDQYVASLTPTTTVPTTTTPPPTTHAASRSAAATSHASTADDSGVDRTTVAIVVAAAVVVVVGLVVLLLARRRSARRRGQRRASSSARNASGSVTGSRQAKRSHT